MIKHILSPIARLLLKLTGWKMEGELPPNTPKIVFIAVPHTALEDGIWMVIFAVARRIPIRFLVKDGIDAFPFKQIIRWFGGIPVNRSVSHNVVDQIIAKFNNSDRLIFGVSPEGKRAYQEKLRTGFYHIAHGAGVPIVCCYLDYKTRTVGIGPSYSTTGDIQSDMRPIRQFYQDKEGKYSENFNRAMDI